VNSQATLRNHPKNLIQSDLASVIFFNRTSNMVITAQHCKYNRAKKWCIPSINRTIDEDAFVVTLPCHSAANLRGDFLQGLDPPKGGLFLQAA
jgi:hypothetical protein